MKSYEVFKNRVLSKNPEVKRAYDELELEFALIEKLIALRIRKNISQKALADIIGTKQSAISRFESGNYSPTLGFIYKVASALKAKISLSVK